MTPSKSRPNGSRLGLLLPAGLLRARPALLPVCRSPDRAPWPRSGPDNRTGRAASSAACRTEPSGRCRNTPRSPAPRRGPCACRPCPTARSRRRRATCVSSGTTRAGSKSHVAPSPWHAGTGTMRRVERERARRHLRHADAAHDAGELAREQPIAAVERVDDDDVAGEAERDFDRFGEPPFDAAPHDQPIDDDLDRVVAAPVEADVVFERTRLTVDARLGEAARSAAPAVPS